MKTSLISTEDWMNLALFTAESCSMSTCSVRMLPRWSACLTYGSSLPQRVRGAGFAKFLLFPITIYTISFRLVWDWVCAEGDVGFFCKCFQLYQQPLHGISSWSKKQHIICIADCTHEQPSYIIGEQDGIYPIKQDSRFCLA